MDNNLYSSIMDDENLTYITTPMYIEGEEVIYVDEWIPKDYENIIRPVKDFMIIPLSKYFKLNDEENTFDYFSTTSKRCYNMDKNANRIAHYLNYFLRFYDKDLELLSIYYKIKYLIDYEEQFNFDMLLNHINRYIINSDILKKVKKMNDDNYIISLQYKGGKKNESLQFTTEHGKKLMEISILIDMVIPICTHFFYVNGLDDINLFLLNCYSVIFDHYLNNEGFDIHSKLFETCSFNINRTASSNTVLWNKQAIRGINKTTHSLDSLDGIILNIVPRYVYTKNIVSFNFSTIRKMSSVQIYDIQYEYKFYPISLSKRDEDNNSDFDKYESQLIKQDESLYLQNKFNCNYTINRIINMFGPFDEDEIRYYSNNITSIYALQKDLIFNIFYNIFGDPVSINSIQSKRDYIILMLAGKKMLLSNGLVLLPYILSSKIVKITKRNNINKKEYLRFIQSEAYDTIKTIYRNDKIIDNILAFASTIISSEFAIIDYYDKELDGTIIQTDPDLIMGDLNIYIGLINR